MSDAVIERRLLSPKEACRYVGLGEKRGVQFCEQAGARLTFGRRVLYDRQKLDQYIDSQTGQSKQK